MPFVMPGVCKNGLVIVLLNADEVSFKSLDFIFSLNIKIKTVPEGKVLIEIIQITDYRHPMKA